MSSRILFVSETLRSLQPFYDRFYDVMDQVGVRHACLWGETRNLWCRDYMPVGTAHGTLVQFRYWPDYLVRSPKYIGTIVNANALAFESALPRLQSDLIIDGGNVVLGPGYAILTRKVLRENPHYTRKRLLTELEQLLQVDQIVLIPEDPDDFTGHADGMVRAYDSDTVLVNDQRGLDPELGSKVRKVLHTAGLRTIPLPYAPVLRGGNSSAVGCYINYLRHEEVIVVPTFGIASDQAALRCMEELFPRHTTRALDSRSIALQGGVLNCITWGARPELP